MQKRGMSNILTSVLLVLLALAAIVIIWVFIAPLFGKDVGEFGSIRVSAGVVPGSVLFSEQNDSVNLTVRRNIGDHVDFNGFIVVVYDEEGNSYAEMFGGGPYVLGEFESIKVSVDIFDRGLGKIERIEIIPLILDDDGDVIQGRIADKYVVPEDERLDPEEDYEITLLQMADTHVITNGGCPSYLSGKDGRTNCALPIVYYVDGCNDTEAPIDGFPDNSSTCPWLNVTAGAKAVSTAPNNVTWNAVAKANSDYDADYVFISGDLIAVTTNNAENCSNNHNDSFQLFAEMMSNLEAHYFPIGAKAHDHIGFRDTNPLDGVNDWEQCRENYLGAFDDYNWGGLSRQGVVGDAFNWYFVDRDNLFIGLSQTEDTTVKINETFLNATLNSYKNRSMKLFIHTHVPWYCYDEPYNVTFGNDGMPRCNTNVRTDFVYNYKDDYRVIVMIFGHTHANIRDTTDEADGIYHIITTATMNYPTEFRVFRITKDTIRTTMSSSINPDVDDISLQIMNQIVNGSGDRIGWDNMTNYGDPWERDIFIDLS